jgi:hypothetical protein
MIDDRRAAPGPVATATALARTVALGILTACGSQAPEPVAVNGAAPAADDGAASAAKVTFTEVYDQVLNGSCLNCHTGIVGQFDGLDMSTKATAYANTVNKSSSRCARETLVVPGHADSSLLYLKVTSPPCGSLMPQNAPALPKSSIDLIKSWIDEGAPND